MMFETFRCRVEYERHKMDGSSTALLSDFMRERCSGGPAALGRILKREVLDISREMVGGLMKEGGDG